MKKWYLAGLATLFSGSIAFSGDGEAIDASWLAKTSEGAKAVYDKYKELSTRLEEECEIRADFVSKPTGSTTFRPQTRRERVVHLDDNMTVEYVRILDSSPKQPQISLQCDNKDYHFTLSKSREDDAYALRDYALGHRKNPLIPREYGFGMHNLTFWYLKDILAALNNKGEYSLRKLQFDAGKELLLIEYDRTVEKTLIQSLFYIDPSHDWRVVEHRRERSTSLMTEQWSYGIEVGGVDFPIKLKALVMFKGDNAPPANQITHRLISLKITDKKPEYFRLSAFGLPEPIDAPPLPKPTPWYLWVLAAAATSAALAMLFAWLKRRSMKADALSFKAS